MRSVDPKHNYEKLLRDGIMAAKDGNRRLAWSLLNQVTQINALDARPWVWLTETTDDPEEKREYLEQAVAVDPRNMAARRGLAMLTGKLDQDRLLAEGEGMKTSQTSEPKDVQTVKTFLCPQCGAKLSFDPEATGMMCQHCGYTRETHEHTAADREQVLDFVLPTTRGHHWAEAQHRLSCDRCGAVSLWPPGQTALECPYCHSNQLVDAPESTDMVDPQAIALMQFDEKKATRYVQDWLGKGWLAPDDLTSSSKKSALTPSYYSFWTFDGTLDVHWTCEVNEGLTDKTNWVQRTGVEFEQFNDELIPGLRRISKKSLTGLGSYNLMDVVEFKPDYLAGWPTLFYDRPLSKASLLAREQVVRKVRRELYNRVEVGQQKRNLKTGATNWSDMTFKHVLLPVWTGTYHYQGKEYKILVNGQTGKVSGEKPRDTVKAIIIGVSAVVTIIVVLIMLVFLAFNIGWISLP